MFPVFVFDWFGFVLKRERKKEHKVRWIGRLWKKLREGKIYCMKKSYLSLIKKERKAGKVVCTCGEGRK